MKQLNKKSSKTIRRKTARKTTKKPISKREKVDVPKRAGFFRSIFQPSWPQINLSETTSQVKIVANLPGIDPHEIAVDVSDSMVNITGHIQEERQEKGEKFFHFERRHGEFSRDILLPAKIDTRKVSATSKHGVLTITLKKIESETPRKLSIRSRKK